MVKKAYATTRTLLQDKYEGLKQVRQPFSPLLAAQFHRMASLPLNLSIYLSSYLSSYLSI